ncbi:MAG: SAM-dependent methyltransferase [Actinomycetota bacterium]
MQTIRDEIAARGPIPFERFMELALYGPEGFFSTDVLRSVKAGDFLTSPEVSPLFGETLSSFVASEHRRIGDPFLLVECGAGSGSLLKPLLMAYPVEAWAVEVSPPAREALVPVVGEGHVLGALDGLRGELRGVVIANELVDNLPMAIAQLGPDGWREKWVGLEDARLAFLDTPARSHVAGWLDAFAGPVELGGWVEVQLAAANWLTKVLTKMKAGSVVVIDYGDTAENLAPRRRDGTLRTYRAHHLGPHPLNEPGATDITADVNFTALESAAWRAGAQVEVLRQDDFLSKWGLRQRLSELRKAELEAARRNSHMERLALRAQVVEAETLLHPRGLGDFRVLVARN